MKKIGLLTLILMLAIATGTAFAQGDTSTYFVTYYSNNVSAAPDATVRIINDGDTGGNLWADFYVFDDSQELTQCCACEITPDGLLSEDVKTQLTAFPLTGKVPTRGVIKVIADANGNPYNTAPTAGLHGNATHIQAVKSGAYSVTETALSDSNLSAGEQSLLQSLCYYDSLLSGSPCTCTPEDHDF